MSFGNAIASAAAAQIMALLLGILAVGLVCGVLIEHGVLWLIHHVHLTVR